MPQEDEPQHVIEEDEIVIQAGCVQTQCSSGASSLDSSDDVGNQRQPFVAGTTKTSMVTTEEDLKKKVSFGKMRMVIIVLAAVAVVCAIAYSCLSS